jgi:cell shape-determining protein MreC
MDLIQSIIETKNKAIKRLEDRITQLEKENRELRETLAFEERNHRRYNRQQ